MMNELYHDIAAGPFYAPKIIHKMAAEKRIHITKFPAMIAEPGTLLLPTFTTMALGASLNQVMV